MRRVFSVVVMISLLCLWSGSAFALNGMHTVPTEVLKWDKAKAYNGYTLFTPLEQREGAFWTYLIDMEGNIVHSFSNPWLCRNYTYLLENGRFARLSYDGALETKLDVNGLSTAGGVATHIQELNWDGSLFWEYYYISDKGGVHHDFQRIWNKKLQQYTYIFAAWQSHTKAETLAKYGYTLTSGGKGGSTAEKLFWSPDSVVEVNYNKEVVWKWEVYDHLLQETKTTLPTYAIAKDTPQKLNIEYGYKKNLDLTNYNTYKAPGTDWNHTNAIDYNDEKGHILVNIGSNEFVTIDHDNTFVSATNWATNIATAAGPAGDFKYRFGNPCKYDQGVPLVGNDTTTTPGSTKWGTQGDQQMFFYHHGQWIKPYHWLPPRAASDDWSAPGPDMALPGAGQFMLYDNGRDNPLQKGNTQSAILQINPYIGPGGAVAFDAVTWPQPVAFAPLATGANPANSYVWPHLAGYTMRTPSGYAAGGAKGGGGTGVFKMNNQVTWYFSSSPETFYSNYISGAQRLPNGNTLICSGASGHFFEVTPASEVVWEYLNPKGSEIANTRFFGQTLEGGFDTFRAYRYDPNHPGLRGKDLTPKGTITGRVAGSISQMAPKPAPLLGFGFGSGGVIPAGAGGSAGNTGGGGGAGGY